MNHILKKERPIQEGPENSQIRPEETKGALDLIQGEVDPNRVERQTAADYCSCS